MTFPERHVAPCSNFLQAWRLWGPAGFWESKSHSMRESHVVCHRATTVEYRARQHEARFEGAPSMVIKMVSAI
ncbi:hypothetical protein SLA2020_007110 [Shorea laevis]